MTMDNNHCKKIAEEHWKFLEKWFKMIFIDSFVHGWKHAKETKELK